MDIVIQKTRLTEMNDRLLTLPIPKILELGEAMQFYDLLDGIAKTASTQRGQIIAAAAQAPADPPSDN